MDHTLIQRITLFSNSISVFFSWSRSVIRFKGELVRLGNADIFLDSLSVSARIDPKPFSCRFPNHFLLMQVNSVVLIAWMTLKILAVPQLNNIAKAYKNKSSAGLLPDEKRIYDFFMLSSVKETWKPNTCRVASLRPEIFQKRIIIYSTHYSVDKCSWTHV